MCLVFLPDQYLCHLLETSYVSLDLKVLLFFIRIYVNYIVFRGTKRQSMIEIIEFSKKYGPVFTFWLGPKPFVFIFDIDIGRETFRKNEFTGRPDSYFGKNEVL